MSSIVELGPLSVIGLGVDCPGYDGSGIGPAWERFAPRRGELPQGGRSWGVSLPRENGFYYVAGSECPAGTPLPNGMEAAQIPAARYYREFFNDHPSQMPAAFSRIFHEGLAQAGVKHSHGPVCLEEYPEDWHDEAAGKFRIWLYVQLAD